MIQRWKKEKQTLSIVLVDGSVSQVLKTRFIWCQMNKATQIYESGLSHSIMNIACQQYSLPCALDQISQKSSLNKKIGVKLGNVIFPPLLDHLTEHHWVMWSLSYRADHDNHPGKFVDGIFSINEVSHSMDSWFLHKVLEKAIKQLKRTCKYWEKFFKFIPCRHTCPAWAIRNGE